MSQHFIPTTTNYEVIHGDCLKVLPAMSPESVAVVWTDPPYFLSNGGQTCKNGKRAKVNKGQWDESNGLEQDHGFHTAWVSGCQRVMKPNGSIWVTATHHTLFSIGFTMQQLGFKLLNMITWEKPNPPPNLACRYFTHSTEQIIWTAPEDFLVKKRKCIQHLVLGRRRHIPLRQSRQVSLRFFSLVHACGYFGSILIYDWTHPA